MDRTDTIETLTSPHTMYEAVIIWMHYVISITIYSFTTRSPANGNIRPEGKTVITVSAN